MRSGLLVIVSLLTLPAGCARPHPRSAAPDARGSGGERAEVRVVDEEGADEGATRADEGATRDEARDEPSGRERVAHRSNAGGASGASERAAATRELLDEAAAREAAPAFERAEEARLAFEARHFEPPIGTTPHLVDAVVAWIRRAFSEVGAINADYTAAMRGDDPDRTIAALVGSGRAWDALARAIDAMTTPPSPSTSPHSVDGLPHVWAPAGDDAISLPVPPAYDADAREAQRAAALDAFARAFDPWTRAVECMALGRYALAARAARAAVVRTPTIEHAWERLARTPDARIATCIETIRTGDAEHGISADPTFARYSLGEFYRPPLGITEAISTLSPPLDGP